MAFLSYLHRVVKRENLTTEDARDAMLGILTGEASTAQVAGFLVALKMKGETAEEILGFAQAMREKAHRVSAGTSDAPLLDTCGTGGDGPSTFNISTIAAFVVAGAGVRVAKHGNRSISSQCGSADVLEAMGVRIDLTPAQSGAAIRETGIGFLFAPAIHPAMKHAQAARVDLKMRTAFNLLGPLTNPAGATAQLVGAPSAAAAELMAKTLACLGLQKGFVVHGSDGLDEITTTGTTHVLEITKGAIADMDVTPDDFGVPRAKLADLRGGNREENAATAFAILDGEQGPRRDIVLVNSAAALVAAGKSRSFLEAMAVAAESIDSGAALAKVRALSEFTRRI